MVQGVIRTDADDIPEVVVSRLPVYARALAQMLNEGKEVVSSQDLGDRLQVTPAQIRKDLSYFGRFGKQGRGYSIRNLLKELRSILGLTREWPVALVGVGRLGKAILGYPGFAPEGFKIVAAFDVDDALVDTFVGSTPVKHISQLESVLAEQNIKICIVAVPAAYAQGVTNRLVQLGVKAILNYAPVSPEVPPGSGGVKVRNMDPVLALQSMTFYLKPASRRSERREVRVS